MTTIEQQIDSLYQQLDKVLPKCKYNSVNILYIDDEVNNLNTFKANLRTGIFGRIFVASTYEDAREILKNNPVHIVFCDYKMPRMNGAEVLTKIGEEFPKVSRAILTAFASEETKKQLRKFNINTCLSKPFDFPQIIEHVKQAYNLSIQV